MSEERINLIVNDPTFNPKLKGKDALIYRTIEELTYAIAYMTIEVQAQGLSASIVGRIGNELSGSFPDIYTMVKEKLNLSDNIILVTLLAIGFPSSDSQKPPKVRKSSKEVISYESI